MNLKFIFIHTTIYILLTLSALSDQGISLHKFREAGDSLDISIQQELDRSSSQAVQWIKNRQNNDGSWGDSNKIMSTAICVLALASQNDPSLSEQIQSAIQFIKKNCITNGFIEMQTTAWTTAALLLTDTQGCISKEYCNKLKSLNSTLSITDQILRREIIMSFNLQEPDQSSTDSSKEHLVKLSHKLNTNTTQMLQMWLDARLINRKGNGSLIKSNGQRVDWRRIYAQKIISSQKIDPYGGGFWQRQNHNPCIHNTALAILILKEL